MNVLVLYGGKAVGSGAGEYPLCLTEIGESPVIERVLGSCQTLDPKELIVSFRGEDIDRYHVDNVARLLAPDVKVVRVNKDTQGAACTALLASPYIDNSRELLVLNGDELLDVDFSAVIRRFRDEELSAGTVVFDSIHPRYSYVVVDENERVVEAAEKNPISRNATAGFYWYAQGSDFVAAAKSMVRKDARVSDKFFICPVFNELILRGRQIGVHRVDRGRYHPLKTERHVDLYETQLRGGV